MSEYATLAGIFVEVDSFEDLWPAAVAMLAWIAGLGLARWAARREVLATETRRIIGVTGATAIALAGTAVEFLVFEQVSIMLALLIGWAQGCWAGRPTQDRPPRRVPGGAIGPASRAFGGRDAHPPDPLSS